MITFLYASNRSGRLVLGCRVHNTVEGMKHLYKCMELCAPDATSSIVLNETILMIDNVAGMPNCNFLPDKPE